MPAVTEEVVKVALCRMVKNRAVGTDGVPVEMLMKLGQGGGVHWLVKLSINWWQATGSECRKYYLRVSLRNKDVLDWRGQGRGI